MPRVGYSRGVRLSLVACAAAMLLQAPAIARQRGSARAAPPLVVKDVTLIDGTGAAPRPHVSLVVRDGRIAAIDAAGRELAGTTVVDGAGSFAIPGLFDAHVHLSGGPHADAVAELKRAVEGGVTSVWDMAGDDRETSELGREAAAGEIPSPTIHYVSLMAGPAFFTDPRVLAASKGFPPGEAPWAQAITPATDLARAVAMARGTGAGSLKLYAALDGDAVRRVTAEARRQGLRVVAHATVFPAKPSDLVDAGVTMLAHAPYLAWEGSPPTSDFTKRASGDFAGVPADSPAIERVLEGMRDKGIALNPTLWIFAERMPQDEISRLRTPWMYAVTRRAAALGVPIVAGTDGMIDRRDALPSIHREIELLVTGAGLTPMQAIQAASRNPARAAGIDATSGTLEAGKVADILLLDANPLDDIRNTRRIRAIIARGAVVR